MYTVVFVSVSGGMFCLNLQGSSGLPLLALQLHFCLDVALRQ